MTQPATPAPTCRHSTLIRLGGGRCPLCAPKLPQVARSPSRLARDRVRLRRSLARFAAWAWPIVTGAELVSNPAVDALLAALQRVGDGEVTRLLVSISPGTGKSTCLTVYMAWRLARDPGHRAIRASHAYEIAAHESRRLRRFVESDEFRAMFPAVQIRDDENQVGAWGTTRDGRVIVTGTDGALTGRRTHEAIVDDGLNAVDRRSSAVKDRLHAWHGESLSTRLDGDRAPLIVVGQRLALDDLHGRLLDGVEPWERVDIPALDDDGEPTAPNVLGHEKLAAARAIMTPAAFACQYLQAPSSDDDAGRIDRRWWRFHGESAAPRPRGCDVDAPAVPTPTRFDRVVIACDLTFGGVKATNDYAVAIVVGAVGAKRYALEAWRKRASQLEQRDAIRALARRYPRAHVLVEVAAGGAGVLELLRADGIPRLEGVRTGGLGKVERLDLVSPTIQRGDVFLPTGAPWVSELVEECAGAARHDDLQDAIGYALQDLATHQSSGGVLSALERRHRNRAAAADPAARAIERQRLEDLDRELNGKRLWRTVYR